METPTKSENVVSLKAITSNEKERLRTFKGTVYRLHVMIHNRDKNRLKLTYAEKMDDNKKFSNAGEMMKFQLRLQFQGPSILGSREVKLNFIDRLRKRTLNEKARIELKRFDAYLDRQDHDLNRALALEAELAQ